MRFTHLQTRSTITVTHKTVKSDWPQESNLTALMQNLSRIPFSHSSVHGISSIRIHPFTKGGHSNLCNLMLTLPLANKSHVSMRSHKSNTAESCPSWMSFATKAERREKQMGGEWSKKCKRNDFLVCCHQWCRTAFYSQWACHSVADS